MNSGANAFAVSISLIPRSLSSLTTKADAQLHRMNWSYTRSVLETLMRGDLSFLDGLISTNTCDHMLRLAGELEDKAEFPVHYFSM
jgi:hypothetical protein